MGFQWLQLHRERAEGPAAVPLAWEALDGAPEFATRDEAISWIRSARLDAGFQYRIAEAPIRTRTVVVLEGLDDVPAAPPAEPDAEKRTPRPRCPKCEKVITAKAQVEGLITEIDGVPWHRDCCADELAKRQVPQSVEVSDLPPGVTAEDVEDRAPLPNATLTASPAPTVPAPAEPANPTGPWVDVRGKVIEIFDGAKWWWQTYQKETTAEKNAGRARDEIERGDACDLRGITVMMRPGRAPAEAA